MTVHRLDTSSALVGVDPLAIHQHSLPRLNLAVARLLERVAALEEWVSREVEERAQQLSAATTQAPPGWIPVGLAGPPTIANTPSDESPPFYAPFKALVARLQEGSAELEESLLREAKERAEQRHTTGLSEARQMVPDNTDTPPTTATPGPHSGPRGDGGGEP